MMPLNEPSQRICCALLNKLQDQQKMFLTIPPYPCLEVGRQPLDLSLQHALSYQLRIGHFTLNEANRCYTPMYYLLIVDWRRYPSQYTALRITPMYYRNDALDLQYTTLTMTNGVITNFDQVRIEQAAF